MQKKKNSKVQKKVPGYAWILKNLGLAVVFVFGLVLVSSLLLRMLTQHNKEILVPDFTNMTYQEARSVASKAGLRVYEGDSVYVRQMRRGGVYNQLPKAGEMVKKGRRIMLTTNTRAPKKIAMPSLVGLSMYMAKTELASKGLLLGKLIYVRDIATNNVIRQQYLGRDIKAGDLIESGAVVDLVVGLNAQDGDTYLPSLVGKKYMRAVEAIHENSLNVGKVEFDKTVRSYADSINAFVWQQNPEPVKRPVTMGSSVSIRLTLDESKLEK